MNVTFFESFPATKIPVKSIEELGAIHARAFKRIADIQVSLANLGIEGTVAQARLLSGSDNYSGLVAEQSAFAGDISNRFLELSREAADVVSQTRDEYSEWMKKNFEVPAIEFPVAPKARAAAKPARRSSGKKAA